MDFQLDLNYFSPCALLTIVCVIIVFTCTKSFFGKATKEKKFGTFGRPLGHLEAMLDLFSEKRGGTGNICVVVSLLSKQTLSHQQVRDALVMLAKRQPMLRAFIKTMENGDRYFEIQKINEILSMIDFSTSDVKHSNWQDIWFEQTAKQMRNGLLWRVVVLQEEFVSNFDDYSNTLMFTFKHSCIDGISCVKFCKQFLHYLNDFSYGTNSVNMEVSSLDLLPYSHEIITRKGIWYPISKFMLTYLGLRAVLKTCLQRMSAQFLQTKQYNPFYSQFPPSLEVSSFAGPSRLSVKVFTADETKNIIQACRENNCTVTGALTAAAHLAFCQLIEDGLAKDRDVKLQYEFSIHARRFCDPKPHEEYLGCFVYLFDRFYLNYLAGDDVLFWKIAQEATRGIKDFVKNEEYISNETLASKTMKPKEFFDVFDRKLLIRLSSCNFVSSLGSFNFDQDQQHPTYKLHECLVNDVNHGFAGTFSHFNHTINGKMTWQIVSDMSRVNNSHAEEFANLCFGRFSEIASA